AAIHRRQTDEGVRIERHRFSAIPRSKNLPVTIPTMPCRHHVLWRQTLNENGNPIFLEKQPKLRHAYLKGQRRRLQYHADMQGLRRRSIHWPSCRRVEAWVSSLRE
ncbi:hypothetical protein PJW07_25585, partial [Agrobacterium salinitolerans]|uniref:hypothetical protein n=1 Tax=Agrobacterium salinitolerans TaxID=1183413 RepID=UPI002301A0AE